MPESSPTQQSADREATRTEAARGVPIRLTELTKHYPGQAKPAVDAVSMEIPAGEIVVFVGPVRLRQDHHDEDDQPADRADRRDASCIGGEDVTALDPYSCAAGSATSSSRSGCSRT